jgi:hypothetical protein
LPVYCLLVCGGAVLHVSLCIFVSVYTNNKRIIVIQTDYI